MRADESSASTSAIGVPPSVVISGRAQLHENQQIGLAAHSVAEPAPRARARVHARGALTHRGGKGARIFYTHGISLSARIDTGIDATLSSRVGPRPPSPAQRCGRDLLIWSPSASAVCAQVLT